MKNLVVLTLAGAAALAASPARAQLALFDGDRAMLNAPCGTSNTARTVEQTNSVIDRCINHIDAELEDIDDNTERLSATSVAGALGAVASGLTGQAAGTMNAWLALGLGPVIADDVQQRPQVAEIHANVRSNLYQLRCRANFLVDQYWTITFQDEALDERVVDMERLLEQLAESHPNLADATSGSDARLKAIADEAFRVLGEAKRLQRRMALLPDDDEIGQIQLASYNNVVREMDDALRARNVSPINAFRGVLAAPFRATATFLGPSGTGAPPNYVSVVSSGAVSLTAAFRIRTQTTWATPSTTWAGTGTVPSYLQVRSNGDRQIARELATKTEELLLAGMTLENDLSAFITLASEGAEYCPDPKQPPAETPATTPPAPKP